MAEYKHPLKMTNETLGVLTDLLGYVWLLGIERN